MILASASPRRRQLLALVEKDFTVEVAQVDETFPEGPLPQGVMELARRKAHAVSARFPDKVVLGADTVVVLDGRVLGKPTDENDAFRMLSALSGRKHEVITGVALCYNTDCRTFYRQATVEFSPLTSTEIREYIATGEPMDKAGSYGIQEQGARFVRHIDGDYFAIVGLPVHDLYQQLKTFPPSKPV